MLAMRNLQQDGVVDLNITIVGMYNERDSVTPKVNRAKNGDIVGMPSKKWSRFI